MIPIIWLIAAVTAGVAGVTIAVYWKDIVAWMKHTLENIPKSIKENLQGFTAFVKKLDDTINNLVYFYSYDKDNKKWTETVVSREVDPNDVPEEILNKVRTEKKVDISEKLQETLKLEHS